MKLQAARIREQPEKEKTIGLPLPHIRLEIEALVKLAQTLIDKKIELGIYTKAPQDLNGQGSVPYALINQLSLEQGQRAVKFGTTLPRLFQRSQGSKPDN